MPSCMLRFAKNRTLHHSSFLKKFLKGGHVRIGFTYDLRSQYRALGYSDEVTAEMDHEETIAAITEAIAACGHDVVQIGHARHLIDKLAAGDRFDLVFNICEGLSGISREAQVPAILDAFAIPYTFSDPLTMCVCLHKGLTKSLLRDAGIPTTDFWSVETLDDLRRVHTTYPAFAKPMAEGTGKGISSDSKVADATQLSKLCSRLLSDFSQPVLVEPYLPGREFTVSILGRAARAEALGTLEIALRPGAEPDAYGYANKERCEELVDYIYRDDSDPQVAQAERTALAAWRVLGCCDAGRVDLRCDADGVPHVLEINPLPGLHPSHSDLPMTCSALGITYQSLIARIIDNACERAASQSQNSQRSQPRRPHLASQPKGTAHSQTSGANQSL